MIMMIMWPALRKIPRASMGALLALGLAGCAAAPHLAEPTSRVAAPAQLDAVAAKGPLATPVDRWWMLWGDPALNRLVEKALVANADIRAAQAHVKAARALVSVAESALYPTIAANGSAWGSAGDADIDGTLGSLIAPYTQDNAAGGYLVGLGARWEPDVFGGRHADVAAAKALSQSSARLADGVRLIVVGDVVENYQQWQGLRDRLAILDRSIKTAGRLVDYVVARQHTGAATVGDVSKARAALQSLEASRPPILSLIDARRRRLAVLAGDLPEQLPEAGTNGALIIPLPPAGQLPSAILDRRPDVGARALIVEARAQRLNSLKTDLLPRFGISFLGQNGHLGLSGLPGFGGTVGLVGINASIPIFTGGLLRGRIEAGNAELEAALAAYDRSVLAALEEVETAYGFRGGLDERLTGLERTLALSKGRADQAQHFYRAGRMTLGEVLQAELDALSDEDKREQARVAQGTATVQLFRALGGGWTDHAGTN